MTSTTSPYYHQPYNNYHVDDCPRFYPRSTLPDEIFDDNDQIPTVHQFEDIINSYLNTLSPKKRDKALVDQQRYAQIQHVLRDPRNTSISTAQFRFWVKKMFQFQIGTCDVVCHDNKPVATKEHIYDILVKAHREAHHGGRDKTSAIVRKRYSWIPKELVARFVRHCPFCIIRRNSGPAATKVSSPPQFTRHAYSFDSGITTIYTPSPFKEDIDMSSGPSTSVCGYEISGNYVCLSSSPSPKKSCFCPMYDQEDHGFLDCSSFSNPINKQHCDSMHSFTQASHASIIYTQNNNYSLNDYYCSDAFEAVDQNAVAAAAATAVFMRPSAISSTDLLSHRYTYDATCSSMASSNCSTNQFLSPIHMSENSLQVDI
ncbi:hypothetical protein G6F62_005265 [Rhizopus arrhizus]|nr:hypothetical protein G6F62_005265 [Rhizopus arrhizus]